MWVSLRYARVIEISVRAGAAVGEEFVYNKYGTRCGFCCRAVCVEVSADEGPVLLVDEGPWAPLLGRRAPVAINKYDTYLPLWASVIVKLRNRCPRSTCFLRIASVKTLITHHEETGSHHRDTVFFAR